jgi:catechol 2,3-dioxygenase-like lactoylglutathione lyase family enzyme
VSRVQLALNVSDLDAAVEFYSKLFGSPPAKVRPGYAQFSLADPPLKLVLIEKAASRGRGIPGALNHLGIEVIEPEDVARASQRMASEGLRTTDELETICCYALQDKVWVEDPDATPWEVYAVLADAPNEAGSCGNGTSICCELQDTSGSSAATCC